MIIKRSKANRDSLIRPQYRRQYPEGTLDFNLDQRNSQDSDKSGAGSALKLGKQRRQPANKEPTAGKGKQTANRNKERNDSFHADKQIKCLSLNFFNNQFESQFRSTSDIASCVSLIGLPITLLCAFLAYVYLYNW